ncbi:nitroreductase family protein, partial [Staphylococcus equorum]
MGLFSKKEDTLDVFQSAVESRRTI